MQIRRRNSRNILRHREFFRKSLGNVKELGGQGTIVNVIGFRKDDLWFR